MTDQETLFTYRWQQAIETLGDTHKLLRVKASPRSIVNRAYYAMFYAVLALFLRTEIKARTSKHTQVIGIFDSKFILTNKLSKDLSRILHDAFDDRQEYDYREFSQVTIKDAEKSVKNADKFIEAIKAFLHNRA